MTVYSLFSGSKGNCTFVRAGNARILIDAGMSCRAIERALSGIGESLSDISAIFITHEHSDHVKALPVLLKKHPVPVHITEPSAKELARSGFPTDCFCIHPQVYSQKVTKTLELFSFPTPHDSRMSVGYRISAAENDGIHIAALATDIGCVTEEIRTGLSGAEAVIVEANHDENMLLMGSYPYELKRRILSDHGHLSNTACGEFVSELVSGGTKHILLAHLSEENNIPDLAYMTVRTALEKTGYETEKDFSLAVAKRDSAVCLISDDSDSGEGGASHENTV